MKRSKPSFAAVTAILVICFTLVAKAQQRKITQCYTVATLMDSSGQIIRTYPFPWECFGIRFAVNPLGYRWMADHPALLPVTVCEKEEVIFCCVTFELDPNAPLNVPQFSIDGMFGRFKVVEVKCKPQ